MKVQIIIGSNRPNRVSNKVGKWVALEAKELDGVEVEIVDLTDYDMPFFDEAIPPQYNPERKPSEVVKNWIDKLAEADAYVIVTPEYNRAAPAVLKNALDYVDFQFAKKPTALVGHGSTGGAQAVASLRAVLAGIKSFSTPTTTYISGRTDELIDESGQLLDEEIKNNPYGPHAALTATLTELKWYGDALKAARS